MLAFTVTITPAHSDAFRASPPESPSASCDEHGNPALLTEIASDAIKAMGVPYHEVSFCRDCLTLLDATVTLDI